MDPAIEAMESELSAPTSVRELSAPTSVAGGLPLSSSGEPALVVTMAPPKSSSMYEKLLTQEDVCK